MKTLKTLFVMLAFWGLSLSVAHAETFMITSSGSGYSVSANLFASYSTLQSAINFIKTRANGADCTILFGNGSTALNIGGGSTTLITFDGSGSPKWGKITLTGKITTSNTTTAGVIRLENGVSINSNADITVTSAGTLLYNNSTGTITISGGIVRSAGDAIVNISTGVLNISGSAQVSTTTTGVHSAIHNPSGGTINISGGTVSGGSSYAIYNNSTQTITISGGTVQTTTRVAIWNNSTGTVNISNSTVRATGAGGRAIYNVSTGAVNISGSSQISSTTGITIDNNYAGRITISGNANITSANTNNEYGTIFLYGNGTSTGDRLVINGGTVSNTAAGGNAISNNSVGRISISGSTVQATTGSAIRNSSTGTLNISGGTVQTTTGEAIRNSSTGTLNISGGTVLTTNGVAIRNNSTGTLNISGGAVKATGAAGRAIYNVSTGAVNISGSSQISSTKGITVDNANAGRITISGNATVTSANTNYEYGTIFLYNAGTATSDRLVITGGTVSNTAVDGNAIRNNSVGSIKISGGTVNVIESSSFAIYNLSTGEINISGGTVSSAKCDAIVMSISSAGSVNISGGVVLANRSGYYAIGNYSTGKVNINGGIMFAYGKVFTDVIFGTYTYSSSGSGVIVAWDNSAGKTNYFIGSSTDIFKFPLTATALWDKIGSNGGISISHGGTTGFIPLDVTVGVNTGISETKTESVQVYPNPASDVLNFSIETTYEIADMQGRVLQKSDMAVNSINISSLPAGIYFVILNTDTGKTVKKIMKK